ncbi:MAG: pyrroline-5-carboxylate reductase [Verrucomicrobiae bacterium]|nr:pyrroline-5-carboxylate reductase [Verrucomicrobiae bacterium]
MTPSLSFLGAGRMARALIRGLLQAPFIEKEKIFVSSRYGESAQELAREYQVNATSNNEEAIMASPLIFLCTKPAQALEALSQNATLFKNKLIISIAAGILLEDLYDAAGREARIIRTMPNIAVRIGKGVTTITSHHSATADDMELTARLFTTVGKVFKIGEKQTNATTAVSGSGPAFALLFLEALFQGGIQEGLDPSLSRALSAHVLASSAALILETEDSPAALRAEIASPKGTTEAGLNLLEVEQFSNTIIRAVHAATKRAQELAS